MQRRLCRSQFGRSLALILSATALLAAAPAAAVSSEFVAQLTSVWSDTLGTGLSSGSRISGDFTAYGCGLGNDACFSYYGIDPQVGGQYFDSSFILTLRLPGRTLASGPNGPLTYVDTTVLNSDPGSGNDFFGVSGVSANAFDVSDPFANSWTLTMGMGLTDQDGLVFDSGAVPDALPLFDRFEDSSFHISVYHDPSGMRFEAIGEIIALPEPSSAVMVGLGLAGLAMRRRAGRAALDR